jgi:hypothetical protein
MHSLTITKVKVRSGRVSGIATPHDAHCSDIHVLDSHCGGIHIKGIALPFKCGLVHLGCFDLFNMRPDRSEIAGIPRASFPQKRESILLQCHKQTRAPTFVGMMPGYIDASSQWIAPIEKSKTSAHVRIAATAKRHSGTVWTTCWCWAPS